MIQDVNLRLPEFPGINSLDMNERTKVYLDFVTIRKVKVGRSVGFGFWLRDQYAFDFQAVQILCVYYPRFKLIPTFSKLAIIRINGIISSVQRYKIMLYHFIW